MASSLAYRILAISITIALCSPLSSGFTIHRTESVATTTHADPSQHTLDLTSEESVQLQVKDLTRRPNDINNGKGNTKAAENKQKQEVVTFHVVNNKPTPTPEVSIMDIRLPNSVEKTEAKGENNTSATETLQIVSNNSEPNTNNYTDIISENLIKEINDIDSILKEVSIDTTVTSTNTDEAVTETTVYLTTEKQSSDLQLDITTQAMRENETEEITTVPNKAVSELQDVGEVILTKVSKTDKPKDKVIQSINDLLISKGDTFNDEDQITTTEPIWKKYVTIDRKRTSYEDLATESTVDDYLYANPTDNIPPLAVPSPEREDLQSEYNHHIISTASDQDITTIESKTTENDQIVSSLKTDDKRLINYSIDTKRAGFLDYSKISPYESMTTTTETNESNEPTFAKGLETTPSHSDNMSEDAIKEELLREEVMNNEKRNQENIRPNSNNYHVESTVQTSDGTSSTESSDVSSPMHMTTLLTPFTDALSVQPIHHDRRTTLYTISPNYKPMKKIDVQPPKQLVRDPDDNSWRNESISSLGIVFKPKNASKSFKEVLKNKTETEFNMLLDNKDSKNEVPDLRLRLEKIAEVRKSKKKKTNKAGEVVYIDYEENSSAESPISKLESHLDRYSSTTESPETTTLTTYHTTSSETTTLNTYHETSSEIDDIFHKFKMEADMTTENPKKFFNDYYDTTDEDDDYVTPPYIDLKKNTRFSTTDHPTINTEMRHHTPAPFSSFSVPSSAQRFSSFPERKPTIDYFPPRRTTTPKVNIDHYDDDFQKKVNYYTSNDPTPEFIYPTEPVATDKPSKPQAYPRTTSTPRLSSPHGFVPNEGNFNRGSYVIKHYRDILRDAVKSSDDVRDVSYIDQTSSQRFPENEEQPPTLGKVADQDYMDYDLRFRKEALNRFVDNFNQNSEKYKIDFPIIYNNSVVHQKYDEGRVSASSSTFVKGIYGHPLSGPSRSDRISSGRKCEPHCDLAVELSPAYELHYYVPDQEEKEQVDVPFSFKV